MTSIEPYGRTTDLLRTRSGALVRQSAREIERINIGTTLGLARIDAVAEIQTARVSAVAYVARRAMQDVALLSQVELQLAEAVPHASGRLATIADLAATALGEIVVDTARRVRR